MVIVAAVCDQMRWFVCEKLAKWFRYRVAPTSSPVGGNSNDSHAANVRVNEQQTAVTDPNKIIKNDWTIAAAVIDRIFSICFGIIFLAGSIIFFIIFAIGQNLNRQPEA